MIFGSMAWVTPRFGLAPPTAGTGDGAFNQKLINWWRSSHVLPPFCLDRSALRTLGGCVFASKVNSSA